MFETKNTSLEEQIIILLIHSSLPAKVIHAKINVAVRHYSLQAIYDQLRRLTEDEVLIKQKQNYTLNKDWVIRIKHLFSFKNDVVMLPGQKNTYSCATLSEADKQWKNIFYTLGKKEDIFIYNTNPFWYLLNRREDSEKTFYSEHSLGKYKSYCVLAANTKSHQQYRKKFSSPHFFVEIENAKDMFKNNAVTICGDYILSIKIDPKIEVKITSLFKAGLTEQELREKINMLDRFKSKHKLIIEHNPKKALIYKKRIGKIFFSRKKMEEMFLN